MTWAFAAVRSKLKPLGRVTLSGMFTSSSVSYHMVANFIQPLAERVPGGRQHWPWLF